MSEPTPLLALARDPGGAEALVPLLQALSQEDGIRLVTYGFDHAGEIFDRARLGPRAVAGGVAARNSPEWAEVGRRLVAENSPKLAIVATSFDPGPELAVVGHACQAGVPTLAVLDQWTNYARRFSRTGDETVRIDELPDMIAVMDDFAVAEMVAVGFPKNRLHVVGQAALDRAVDSVRSQARGRQRRELRDRLGTGPEETLVTLFSQPLRRLYGPGRQNSRGYDERDTLCGLLEALAVLVLEGNSPRLVIKLHPKEADGKFSRLIDGLPFPVVAESSLGAESLIAASDVVVGMTTVALITAFVSGRYVISYQPNLVGVDPLMLGRAGHLNTATGTAALCNELRAAVGDPGSAGTRSMPPCLSDGESVARLQRVVRELLSGHQPDRVPTP